MRCKDVRVCVFALLLSALTAKADFQFAPISQPILSADLSTNLAALNANRFVFGIEVNSLSLVGLGQSVNLSDALFGSSSFPDTPKINQAPNKTGIFSVALPSSFFTALATGDIGLNALITDTQD